MFQEFLAMIDWNDDEAVQMETTEFWVKGLDGGHLKAENYDLEMGHNNRAWLNDVEYDDSC